MQVIILQGAAAAAAHLVRVPDPHRPHGDGQVLALAAAALADALCVDHTHHLLHRAHHGIPEAVLAGAYGGEAALHGVLVHLRGA